MPDPVAEFRRLPEFTRSLRGFAAVGALGLPDHDRLFDPLLAARKAASRAATLEGQVAAFDAERLRRSLRDALGAISAERAPKAGADRRAVEAWIEELALPAFLALNRMEIHGVRVRGAPAADRTSARTSWVGTVQQVFDATDRFFCELQGALGPPPVRRRKKGGGVVRAVATFGFGGMAAAATLRAQHFTTRVQGVLPESLLAHGFDVVGQEPGAVLVVADSAENARMAAMGWRGEAMAGSRVRGLGLEVAAAPRVYRSYDDPARGVRRFIDSLVRSNPRVSVDTLGRSFEGRAMLAVKIGPRGDSPARPNVLFMAAYHAREWVATEMALRLIAYLASPPPGNPRVDSLVAARDIWIVPVANPDGYEYTFTNDRLWRKTRSPQASGAVGVDMNRNHRFRWGLDNLGSSADPQSEIFRGPSPASEIEIRNIEAFHALHPPVISASYHSYAGLLLFPPGAVSSERPADLPVYQALAGSNLWSAVTDRVPGSARSVYSPASAWMLYPTNGDYNDWVSTRYGTITFTPEISSGYTAGKYYGFEFPDNEQSLRQLFEDNLPFALDLVESARDPLSYVSPTTSARSDRTMLESVSPDVRATVPSADAPGATLLAPDRLGFRIDSAAGGRYTRRLISAASSRPRTVSVVVAGRASNFTVLDINGAERADTGWTGSGFRRDSLFVRAGKYSWFSDGGGELRSPVVRMPSDADTVSLVFWTRYLGSGFTDMLHGFVMASLDGGASFRPVLRLQGAAPLWYPERVTIGGVKGKQLVFAFTPVTMAWGLDEIAVVAHMAGSDARPADLLAFRPSENPVRRRVVYFSWPFAAADGDLQVFDFSGHLVWKTTVENRLPPPWDLGAAHLPNGVYVAVARSSGRTVRLKLYVARDGS